MKKKEALQKRAEAVDKLAELADSGADLEDADREVRRALTRANKLTSMLAASHGLQMTRIENSEDLREAEYELDRQLPRVHRTI